MSDLDYAWLQSIVAPYFCPRCVETPALRKALQQKFPKNHVQPWARWQLYKRRRDTEQGNANLLSLQQAAFYTNQSLALTGPSYFLDSSPVNLFIPIEDAECPTMDAVRRQDLPILNDVVFIEPCVSMTPSVTVPICGPIVTYVEMDCSTELQSINTVSPAPVTSVFACQDSNNSLVDPGSQCRSSGLEWLMYAFVLGVDFLL